MGGGGVMRAAAAKVAGFTVANGGFRGFTPDHPVCAAARTAVRPVSASAMLSVSENPAVDATSVQMPCFEFDDWEFSDGEETAPSRLVFGGAPTLQEAKEATSDLKEAIENMFLSPANHFGSSQATGADLSLSSHNLKTKSCDNSDITVSTPPAPRNALQAFRFLSESAAAQSIVASIASDSKVWEAVLENPELKKFIEAYKFSASSAGSNLDVEESVADNGSSYLASPRSIDKSESRSRFADFFNKYLALPRSSDKSESRSKVADFFSKYIPSPRSSDKSESQSKVADIFSKMKVAVIDMMSSLSDYFQNIFGGDNVVLNADGSAKIGVVEKTVGASLLGLAIMVIMVVVLKRV